MKRILTVGLALLMCVSAQAKPMTGSVTSWEGAFTLRAPHIPIKAEGGPPLFMWLYQLDQGSKGTAVGFSNADGDMMFSPRPQEKGVQPVYTGHSVFLVETGVVEVIVTYDVQGNGGMKMAEKYIYDGKAIRLATQTTFFGKANPEWKRTDGEPQGGGYSTPAARSPKPTPRAFDKQRKRHEQESIADLRGNLIGAHGGAWDARSISLGNELAAAGARLLRL